MWLTQAFQSRLANALSKPEEPRLHVRRKGGDFCDNGFVKDFDAPSHILYYLIFEMAGRGKAKRSADLAAGRTCGPARAVVSARAEPLLLE